MSVIMDSIIIHSGREQLAMEQLNGLLREADEKRQQEFRKLDEDRAGGTKFFTGEVWAAAFNHLPPSVVDDCICCTDWARPEEVFYYEDAYDYLSSPHTRTVAQMRDA